MSTSNAKFEQLLQAKASVLNNRKVDFPLEKIFHQIKPASGSLLSKIQAHPEISLILEADRQVFSDYQTKDFPSLDQPWFAGISIQYGINSMAAPADLKPTQSESWSKFGKIQSDLVIDPYEIYHSRYCGFDCVSIYMNSLNENDLLTLFLLGKQYSMSTILVARNEKELDAAVDTPARMIGLHEHDSFGSSIPLETICELSEAVPEDTFIVCRLKEADPQKLEMLIEAEVNAVIINVDDFQMNHKELNQFFPC